MRRSVALRVQWRTAPARQDEAISLFATPSPPPSPAETSNERSAPSTTPSAPTTPGRRFTSYAGPTNGQPQPAVELRVVDPQTGTELAPGAVGEVQAHTPRLMSGYWNLPEATGEALLPGGWFRTGDLAEVDEDGYLFLRDRLNDTIVSGGENIYPAEVEDALQKNPDPVKSRSSACPTNGGARHPTQLWFARRAAQAAGRLPWLRAPGRGARLLGNRTASLTRSIRVSNGKLKSATSWAPEFPSAREGWTAAAEVVPSRGH